MGRSFPKYDSSAPLRRASRFGSSAWGSRPSLADIALSMSHTNIMQHDGQVREKPHGRYALARFSLGALHVAAMDS